MIEKILAVHVLKFSVKALKTIAFKLITIAKVIDRVLLLTKSERDILRRNKIFEDKHRGQRGFVIVNGPSLKEQDIDWLENEITFVVSGFFRHGVIKKWQPKYYGILDEFFFSGSEQSHAFFKELRMVITQSIFFIPIFRGYRENLKSHLLPRDKTFYVATAGLPSSRVDFTNVVQSFQSVSAFGLSQAIYMGCNPIYLIGFDHDHLANRGMDRHFYQGGTVSGSPAALKTLAERIPYDEQMKSYQKLWKNYRSLQLAAKRKEIKIYNATKGGYLDVFERIDFEQIKPNLLN